MKSNRHIGIDILKILSAGMVIILHFQGYSGNLLEESARNQTMLYSTNFTEALCISAVNLFVLSSSFASIKKKECALSSGLKHAVLIWLYTVCVSIAVMLVLLLVRMGRYSIMDVLQCVFPVTFRSWWFVSVFVFFAILQPLLNRAIVSMSFKQMVYVCAFLIVYNSVIPTLMEARGWTEINHGYSLVWFVTLYFLGALVMELCDRKESITIKGGIIGYVIFSMLIFASVCLLVNLFPGSGYENYIIRNYAAVPVVLQSISLFSVFYMVKNIRAGGGKIRSYNQILV